MSLNEDEPVGAQPVNEIIAARGANISFLNIVLYFSMNEVQCI